MWGPIKSQIEPVQIFIVGDVKIILLKENQRLGSFSSLKIAIAFCTVGLLYCITDYSWVQINRDYFYWKGTETQMIYIENDHKIERTEDHATRIITCTHFNISTS